MVILQAGMVVGVIGFILLCSWGARLFRQGQTVTVQTVRPVRTELRWVPVLRQVV